MPIYEVVLETPTASPEEAADARADGLEFTSDGTRHRRDVVGLESTAEIALRIDSVRDCFDEKLREDERYLDVDELSVAACGFWEARGRPAITLTGAAGSRWFRDSLGRLSGCDALQPMSGDTEPNH